MHDGEQHAINPTGNAGNAGNGGAAAHAAQAAATGAARRTALVTGGAGFVGSSVAVALAAQGWGVRVVDSLDAACGGNRANLADTAIEFTHADLCAPGVAATAVTGADLVVHCAASISHGRSMREPLADLHANATATLVLLDAVRAHAPAARVIHISTTTQSGPLRALPADESHPDAPIDIYSANRLAAERYAMIHHLVHGTRVTALRFPNLYGPRACLTSPQLTFNNWFIGCALRGEPITIWGDGAQVRSILHIDDAVRAVLCAIERDTSIGQMLLATPRESISVANFAHATVHALGSGRVEFKAWPEGRRAIDVGDAVFNPARAERELGWSARVELADGLRTTAAFFRARAAEYGLVAP